LNTYTGKQ